LAWGEGGASDWSNTGSATTLPTVTVSGAASVSEQSSYALTPTVNYDLNLPFPVTGWSVNWGDGVTDSPSGPGPFPHTYAEAGHYPVAATAQTAGGAVDASAAVTVGEAPATLSLTSVDPVDAGASFTLPLSFTNPGQETITGSVAPAQPAWILGEPDYLVRIPRQEVPATGTVDYRYIDSSFEAPRDMWLRAAVTRPGNPKVVHHIIVRMRRPADYKGPASESFLFTTWVPGLGQGECPPDTGLFVPKGARFNFEIHYTTDGHPHADESEVGLYVAKQPARMLLEVCAAHTRELDIPAGQANAQHTATYYFKRDSMVYGLSPHMHLRGSWFKFELLGPDGHRETLLSVPSYDFNLADELPPCAAATRAGGFVDVVYRGLRQFAAEPE
ncbi:MAG TPA: PKD domain-containing protein, partial [Tepidisphaeraceae bacterium]|nr:PKD domain-containing protein [Tepidisphaeraceae bacterium]